MGMVLRRGPHQAVAEAAYGLYQLGVCGVVAELVAEALDVDVDRALVYVFLLAPHLPEERRAWEDPSRASGQGVEEFELAGGEEDLLTVLQDLDLIRVDLQLPDEDPARVPIPGAFSLAEDLLYARHEFPWIDRRAHVVVGPELYTDDAVHGVLIPEERHGRDARLLDGGDHLKPPLIGQTVIHDRDLEVLPAGHLPRLRAGPRGDNAPPLPGERPPQM